MDLFDKSIAENFVFVLTFSDAAKPLALKGIKDKQSGFGDYWHLIKEPKTISVNNSAFFNHIDYNSKINSQFWTMGCECLYKLIQKASSITPKSLMQTK